MVRPLHDLGKSGEYYSKSIRCAGISLASMVRPLHDLGKSGEYHSKSIRRAQHLTWQRGSSSTRSRQIRRVSLKEYQASSASHWPAWFVLFTISANPVSITQRISGELGISPASVVRHLHDRGKSGQYHSENIRRARHLIGQRGSSPSRLWKIRRVSLGEYQASSASHRPAWFVTFTTVENPESITRRVSGELGISKVQCGSSPSRPRLKYLELLN